MTLASVAGVIILIAVGLWALSECYDYIQVKRGIYPRKSQTTLEDIKRLRDQGRKGIAVKRFRQLQENRRIYTEYGAAKKVEEL